MARAINDRCDGGAKELDCFAPLAMTGDARFVSPCPTCPISDLPCAMDQRLSSHRRLCLACSLIDARQGPMCRVTVASPPHDGRAPLTRTPTPPTRDRRVVDAFPARWRCKDPGSPVYTVNFDRRVALCCYPPAACRVAIPVRSVAPGMTGRGDCAMACVPSRSIADPSGRRKFLSRPALDRRNDFSICMPLALSICEC